MGGGSCELVESEDRLDQALDRVRQRLGTPVVADLELIAAGFEVVPGSVAPARLPALLAGAPLTVHGRYRGEPGGALTLRGRLPGGGPWGVTVPVSRAEDRSLARVWARAHLRDLEDRYAAGRAHDPELERRIVATSLEFGVLSRFTAFVALGTVVVERDGRLHRVTQPVDLPHGWEAPWLEPVAVPTALVARRGGLLSVDDAPPGLPRMSPLPVESPGWKLPPRPPEPARRFWSRTPADAAASPPEGDLAGYRRRAAELARALEATPAAALDGRLAAAAVAVAALASDLETVAVEPGWVARLRRLAAELGAFGAGPGRAVARVSEVRDRAVETLRKFAEEPP
jgi:Ca-activated chloride channel family protein